MGQPFEVTIGSYNGQIAVKEKHATGDDAWTVLMPPSAIPCGCDFSNVSMIASGIIKDTYIRIKSFNLCRNVDILKRGYDECGLYLMETDYGWLERENKWFDHLYTSPCECQNICVYLRPDGDDLPLPHPDDGPIDDACTPDPDDPNPEGIYGGPLKQITTLQEQECTLVSITVYPNCDDECDPLCQNKECVLRGSTSPYKFHIEGNVDVSRIEAVSKCYPISCLKLWKDISSYRIEFNFDNDFSVNAGRDEVYNSQFIEEEKKNSINPILDNERVRFEPYWKNGDDDFTKINHIKFSLVFLGEKPDKWTDESEDPPQDPTKWKFLGFTDDDIKYQKLRLKKTFIRLSFYNDPNPTKYLLEHWSTVFVDINLMFSDYIYQLNNMSGINYDKVPIQKYKDPYTGEETEGNDIIFHVFNPYIKEVERIPPPDYDPTPYRKDGLFEMDYSGSGDGYYIYLYDPWGVKCGNINRLPPCYNGYRDQVPNPLYLKLEFNNAKTGKRNLFFSSKETAGCDMDNVFLNKGCIWTKIWVVYNKKLDKFIWYPDSPNVTQDEKCKDTVEFKFWEAHVK